MGSCRVRNAWGGDFCSPALAQDETKPAVEEAAVAATHNHFLT